MSGSLCSSYGSYWMPRKRRWVQWQKVILYVLRFREEGLSFVWSIIILKKSCLWLCKVFQVITEALYKQTKAKLDQIATIFLLHTHYPWRNRMFQSQKMTRLSLMTTTMTMAMMTRIHTSPVSRRVGLVIEHLPLTVCSLPVVVRQFDMPIPYPP